MRKLLLCGAAAVLVTTMVVASAKAADYTVVVLQALTGVGAFAGAEAASGMKVAAEEINASGFMGPGNKLNIMVEDDASDRAQAVTLVSRYAVDPRVLMILGPTIGPTAVPAAQVANERKIVVHPLANTLAVLAAGPFAFISSQPPTVTMPLLAQFTAEKLGVKRCAAMYLQDNESYVDLHRIFKELVEKRGVQMIESVGVRSSETDFSALATRIVAAKPDCVTFFSNAPVAGNVAAQLRTAGLPASVKMIGQSGLATPDLIKFGGAAVEGLVFNADWAPGGAFPRAKEFDENYRKKTGRAPDNYSAMGHSLMYVAATAIKGAGANPTRDSVREQLAQTKDVPVVMGTGLYSRDADRIPHTGMVVLQVKDGKFELLGLQ